MSLVTLSEVLKPALRDGYAVAGLVTLGWEDMRAYVAAAEAEGCPVILQAGPSCREYTPLPVLGAMFRHLAEGASVPVVAHLDHGYTAEDCHIAIDSGFTSVMYDGSRKPLSQNIEETAAIVELAHGAGARSALSAIRAAKVLREPTRRKPHNSHGGLVWMQWPFPLATCICKGISKGGSTRRQSGPSKLQPRCLWSFMEALVCQLRSAARWREVLRSANSTSEPSCGWLSDMRCARL